MCFQIQKMGHPAAPNRVHHSHNGNWTATFTLPRFSCSTEQAITSKEVTRGVRVDIITALAFEVWNSTQYPTPDEYTAVCQKLVSTYPSLKDTVGNGYVSPSMQLTSLIILTDCESPLFYLVHVFIFCKGIVEDTVEAKAV